MTATLAALWRLTGAPRSRMALAALLGALTVVFGVGLMATAGYLISRAAERPAVLSLMVTIVVVRAFGLGRPLIRYLERLTSHDLALRVLGGVRTRFYQRIEPLAPAQIGAYRAGDLLSRMVADIDALQNLYLRGLGPALVALLVGAVSVGVAAAFLPSAAAALSAGLLIGGLLVPAVSGFASRSAGRGEATARGELSAGSRSRRRRSQLAAFGAEHAALSRINEADRKLVSLARRDALSTGAADGLGLIVAGLTTAAVLALAVGAAHGGRLDRVLIALIALLALASFEAVTPLAAAARELSRSVAAGRRVIELTDDEVAVRDPADPAPPPVWPFAITLESVRARYPGQPRPALGGFSLTLSPGEHVALVGPSGAGKTTVANLLVRFLDPERGSVTLAGRDLRDYRQEDVRRMIAVAGRSRTCSRRAFAPTCASHVRTRATRRSSRRFGTPGSGTGSPGSPTASTRSSGSRGPSCQAASGSGSCWRGRCSPIARCWCSTSRPRTSTRKRRPS